jgi:hypothetical protein
MPRGTGTTRVELVLGTGTVEALDRARGAVPRATFVKQALEAALTCSGSVSAAARGPEDGPESERSTSPRLVHATRVRPAPPRASVRNVAPRVHHPRCACPICKPSKKGKA